MIQSIGEFMVSRRTYRRVLLDELLQKHLSLLKGLILDVGGEKLNPRGKSRPESDLARTYYINISLENRPDLIGDALRLPVRAASVDCVICCEVLEHIPEPAVCCNEMFRVLKPGGTLIISTPFMFPIHADPHDFYRYSPDGLRYLCREFQEFKTVPMGGWLGTLGMFLEIGAAELNRGLLQKLARVALTRLGRLLSYVEWRYRVPSWSTRRFSTGYFCIATKSK